MKRLEWSVLGAVGVMFLTGVAFYPYLPESVASHWNAAGEVNGYMPRGWGAFLIPIIFGIVFAILLAVPRIDPKKENIKHFRKYYDRFLWVFVIFSYYIYLLTLLANVGYYFNFTLFIVPAVAALFYFVGVLLPHTKLNFMIGIRTPWTISSEAVWKKTHEAGGVAFKICGVLGLLGTAFPDLAVWFLIVPVLVATPGLVIYSYVLYRRQGL